MDPRNIFYDESSEKLASDPIGDHMARMLNEGAFEAVKAERNTDLKNGNSIFPLLSMTNYNRLMNVLKRGVNIVHTHMNGEDREGANYTKKKMPKPTCAESFRSTLKFFVFFLLPIISMVIFTILSAIIRLYLFIFISLFTLLVDFRDAYKLCPTALKRLLDSSMSFLRDINQKYLCASLLKGRNLWHRCGKEKPLISRSMPTVLLEAVGGNDIDNMTTRDGRKDFFQDLKWNEIRKSFERRNNEGPPLDPKTVRHLMALTFAFAMVHGEHKVSSKSKKKSKSKKQSGSVGNGKHLMHVKETVNKDNYNVLSDRGKKVRTMQSHDGIEMVKSPQIRPDILKRQRSSQRWGGTLSFDKTDETNGKDFGLDLDNNMGSTARARVYSEADVDDFYGTDENSLDTFSIEDGDRSSDEKNKKWLDVGAKIGMRILKSEHVQELIAQKSKTVSLDRADTTDDDLIYASSHDVTKSSDSVSGHIPKPFHTMWQTGDVSEYSLSDSDFSDKSELDRRVLSFTPPMSPLTRRKDTSLSLSPSRRIQQSQFYRASSLPCYPTDSFTTEKEMNRLDGSDTNCSVTSSEVIQWVPREFDANRHLPASMAINHGVISNSRTIRNSSRFFDAREIKMRHSEIKCHRRRDPLMLGVKIVVPLFPLYSSKAKRNSVEGRVHQLATVVSSERIALHSSRNSNFSDALSITVLLDKAFLRNGKFAKMTLRIPDNHRHFPRHSKFPIGDAVATSFGIGILVGWRSNDDCHIVRSLWQKRGQGSSNAYLNRDALHCVMEASVGFKVMTKSGSGKVIGYVNGGKTFCDGQYLVQVKRNGRSGNESTLMERGDILQCTAAKFIPVVEQLKESAKYQMQVDNYEAERLQLMLQEESLLIDKTWRVFSEGFELFLSSFIKAAEEDKNFDSEISNFLSQIISFLEDLEVGGSRKRQPSTPIQHAVSKNNDATEIDAAVLNPSSIDLDETISCTESETSDGAGAWLIKDLFGDILKVHEPEKSPGARKVGEPNEEDAIASSFGEGSYKKIYAVLTTLMRTVSIAKAGCSEKPNLKMALAIIHEILLFVHNVIKVQQVNMTEASIKGWKETITDISNVFGPLKLRLQKIGNGIIQRIEFHGNIAKVRALTFAELLVADDKLIESLEAGDGSDCIARVESAAVQAEIIDEDMREQYHKLITIIYNTLAPRANQSAEAAARNGQKFTFIAKTIKLLATPARSALSLLTHDDVLETVERVLVRVFEKEQDAPLIINIYSWTFRTFRHLRIFNNITIVGNLWAQILDAADEEFAWVVSRTPKNTHEYIRPISKLFSLGVARFHELCDSDSSVSADWLDFLMEDEAIEIIQDLDGALLRFLKNFCNDMKEMMFVLPYYSSIDDDILNLIDEADPERELKEIAEALADTEKFPAYIREKSAKAVAIFLDYLPRISIPIEKREVGEGWVLTCRGRNGKDLTLSNVSIEKDNLLCKVFGGQNVLGLEDADLVRKPSMTSLMKDSVFSSDKEGNVEVSILDHVAELIRNAQNHGCWNVDKDNYEPKTTSTALSKSALSGLPLSAVLKCAIELWENLQLDDDELLEISIREISHQIQKQKTNADDIEDENWSEESRRVQNMHQDYIGNGISFDVDICNTLSIDSNSTSRGRRFDPRKDPTVLYLGMNQLTCCLDDFTYRLEPATSNNIFDPALEGVGSLAIKNASIKIRIECRKERITKLGEEITVPVLQLQELEVGLEKVRFRFKETGVDWVLNKVVNNFSGKITQIVRENLKEQICLTIENALGTLNRYIEVNPDIMLKILGISIDDLEENVAWV